MATIPEALAAAIQHHQAGRFQEAEQIYRRILEVEPEQASAIHLLGVIAFQVGQNDAALQLIGRAIALKGDAAELHRNLGVALYDQRQMEAASAHLRRVLELRPDDAAAHNNLGNIFKETGLLDEAMASAGYHRIDLGLDTFPYNGHTTSLDSAWMGVPVVTLVGKTIVGRVGLSHSMNLGLPELVATSAEQFIEIARDWARDRPRLGRVRATLRERMEGSPLMNTLQLTRDVEAAYRGMWRRWCATARP